MGGSPPRSRLLLIKGLWRGTPRPAWEGGEAVCPTLRRHFRLLPESPSWRLGWPVSNFVQNRCEFLSCSCSQKPHIFFELSNFCLTNNIFLFKKTKTKNKNPKSYDAKETCTTSKEVLRPHTFGHPAAAGERHTASQPAPGLGSATNAPSFWHFLLKTPRP